MMWSGESLSVGKRGLRVEGKGSALGIGGPEPSDLDIWWDFFPCAFVTQIFQDLDEAPQVDKIMVLEF